MPPARPIVFVPDPVAQSGMELLRKECDCLAPWEEDEQRGESDVANMLAQADAVIVRLTTIGADDLDRAKRLKVIAKHGVGLDNIDVAAATRRRIPVVFTPTANSNAVAEHTMALMLALARNVSAASEALRAGHFQRRNQFTGVELAGKTLGVVGLGRIGLRVAEIAQNGFSMRVRAYDPFAHQGDLSETIELEPSLENLLRSADFVSLHVPLTADTHQLINASRLSLMKPACRIINTSRGGVVDEAALARALREGRIAGAALDVFEQEPLPADHAFLTTPNILLTPHISSSTTESLDRMACDAAQGVLDVLHTREPAHLVNPEVFA